MSVEFRLLDHIKLVNRTSINFACSYSEDDRLFILCDTGIYIISLKGLMSCPFPTLACKKEFMKVSDFLPSANIGLDINSFFPKLERIDLYETMLSTEYSANVKHAAPVEPTALKAEWSPRGIVGKTDCALAVLTNLYSLEVYVKHVDENELVEYCLVCNVFKEIYNVEKSKWSIADKFSAELKLAEMKKRIALVVPTAFTWSHLYKLDNTEVCVIFVGHINGDISIWRMNLVPMNSKEQISLAFLGRYSTHLKRIVTLYWHPTMEFGGGLCYADTDGKMSILQITDLDQEAANISSDVAFWTVADKVPVDRITVMTLGGCTYIVLVKQSFLIINGITKRGVVFDQKVENVGNFYITGVYHYKNIILVLTMTGIFKQYVVSTSKSDKILLEEKVIPLKVDFSKLRTHGFFFSKNMVLFGMVVNPYQLRGIARVKSSINMFLFHNVLLNPLYILWQNDTGSLRDHWDCFEVLRLICIKDKRFPWLGLPPDLNYDHLSLLQLKTLRWVAKLSETVFNLVPYIRNYDIKPYIILHYLVEIRLKLKRINTLLNLRNTGKHLSLFQMRSIDLQNFFLKEMVVKNILLKANVGRNFVNEMRDVISIANELRYPPMSQCVWCGEKLIGPLCMPPHADSRCSISMMPIFLVPTYKCPFCKVLAHKEIEKEEDVIYCPYCDVPMEVRDVNENVLKDSREEEVKSVCFDDCLKDDSGSSDIEENISDFVILSDSEDESNESGNRLRTLYARMADMSLEEIIRTESELVGEEVVDSDMSVAGPSSKVMKLEN